MCSAFPFDDGVAESDSHFSKRQGVGEVDSCFFQCFGVGVSEADEFFGAFSVLNERQVVVERGNHLGVDERRVFVVGSFDD